MRMTSDIKIDDSISYCPHCGKRLSRVSVVGKTTCEKCGRTFLCVTEVHYGKREVASA